MRDCSCLRLSFISINKWFWSNQNARNEAEVHGMIKQISRITPTWWSWIWTEPVMDCPLFSDRPMCLIKKYVTWNACGAPAPQKGRKRSWVVRIFPIIPYYLYWITALEILALPGVKYPSKIKPVIPSGYQEIRDSTSILLCFISFWNWRSSIQYVQNESEVLKTIGQISETKPTWCA